MLEHHAPRPDKSSVIDPTMRQRTSPVTPVRLPADLRIATEAAAAHEAGMITDCNIVPSTGIAIEKNILADYSMIMNRYAWTEDRPLADLCSSMNDGRPVNERKELAPARP